jgi:hypothetical protein
MTDIARNHIELESIASEYVGKIVFTFSQLELNINLFLQWAVNAQDFHTVNPLVERLSFKSKIDALVDIVEIKFASSPDCVSEFKSWHSKLDKFRVKRNSFIHGRWGFHSKQQQVINVAPGMIGTKKLKETHYDISELENELLDIKAISNEFHALREKWHV